jgi:hypothetical protein
MHTLTELTLAGQFQSWPHNRGTRLDLSIFPALKLLSVLHFLLFQSPNPDPSQDGVYLFLPSTLEQLKVTNDII